MVDGVERGEDGGRHWYVRVNGEDKDVYSIWLTLGQRTLHYETYFMPAPEENAEACFAHLLKRNAKLYGLAFSIGAEDAVFLAGQLANSSISTTSSIECLAPSTRPLSSAFGQRFASASPRDSAKSTHYVS